MLGAEVTGRQQTTLPVGAALACPGPVVTAVLIARALLAQTTGLPVGLRLTLSETCLFKALGRAVAAEITMAPVE